MGTKPIGEALKGTLQERVLKAARLVFLELGFFKANTRAIASRAGTSESGLFRLFPGDQGGKYALLMAVYNDCWREVNEILARKVTCDATNPKKALVEIIRNLFALYDQDPELISLIIINTGNTDTLLIQRRDSAIVTEENFRYLNRIERLCESCLKKGVISGNLSARALAEGLLGISEGVLLGWYLADQSDKSSDPYPAKISIREAMKVVEKLLN